MAVLINHLEDLNLQKLLDMYQHVSTIHFEPDMFEFFEDVLGKCKGGKYCKPLLNNIRHVGLNNDDINGNTSIKRRRNDITIQGTDEQEIDDLNPSGKDTSFRPLRRVATISGGTDYLVSNGKLATAEERITVSYLDKWHSFLLHPNVKQQQNVIIDDDEEEKKKEQDDEEEDEVKQSLDTVTSLGYFGIGNNSNKFVTDVSKFRLSRVVSTKMNLLNQYSESYDDDNEHLQNDIEIEELYYEYKTGMQIKYHTLTPYFGCMKQELIDNDKHTITQNIWDDTLAKGLLCLEMVSVQDMYIANEREDTRKYGVKIGEVIGIDNVIAILFYCNFDELQKEFSKTFWKMKQDDTESDMIETHCKNFYWLGRALYVAVTFYGTRMEANQVVWHGLSKKMLFDNFAVYFTCPTSTTTQKNVAQTFSGNGNGIVLKLKAKHKNNCPWMLDVSLFSDFTDECERLFFNETLIITDILIIINKRWVSFKKYINACLYFNKITTGNANNDTWNIK
eukprot:35878_1